MLLILAQPRTGSSTLLQACIEHAEIGAASAFEPFRPPMPTLRYPDSKGSEGILYHKYNRVPFRNLLGELEGLKCVKEVDTHIRSRELRAWPKRPGTKTVRLTRRNLLKQAVSMCMAMQTHHWHWFSPYFATGDWVAVVDKYVPRPDYVPTLDPIPLSEVSYWMGVFAKGRILFEARTKGCPILYLTYEELFDDPWGSLGRVLSYGGFDPALYDEKSRAAVSQLFAKGRLNTDETYRKVPNIEEIEGALGSEKDGYLFQP